MGVTSFKIEKKYHLGVIRNYALPLIFMSNSCWSFINKVYPEKQEIKRSLNPK